MLFHVRENDAVHQSPEGHPVLWSDFSIWSVEMNGHFKSGAWFYGFLLFRALSFEFPHFGNFLVKTGTPMRNVFESHLFSEDVQNSERPFWGFLPGGPLPVVNGIIILVNGLIKG